MARIPETDGSGDVAARIRARRPAGRLRPIDRVLLHAPRLADGWNSLLGAIRRGETLSADLRELVILRVAVLNDAPYEWDSHESDALSAGLTAEDLAVLRLPDAASSQHFSEMQRTVVELTDTMTRDVAVPDDLFDRLENAFGVEQLVELILTVAAYNMVSRLVVALRVEERAE